MKKRIEIKLNRAKSLAVGPGGRIAKLLTAGQVKAARLVAEGTLSIKEIAAQCECSVPQLMRWKQLPRFVDECQRQHKIIQGAITGGYISTQKRRLALREQIFQALMNITDHRGKRARNDRELAKQGGSTGLIVEKRQYDSRGSLIQTDYRIDHRTITQMLALMREQAQDLGQWGVQTDISRSEADSERILLDPARELAVSPQ